MKVQVVSFRCVLKTKLGRLISSTFNQNVLTGEAGVPESLPGLGKALEDLETGERRKVSLSAAEAYGYYDPKLVLKVPRGDLTGLDLNRPGDRQIRLKFDGAERLFRIVEVVEDHVTLDGNHPLAGQDLVFEIEATSVRDATPDEIDSSSIQAGGERYLI
jgi:FKBP-type peptidyl-prolyl cis-trans isomerase SlyD